MLFRSAVPVDRGRCPSGRVFTTASADALRALDPSVILDGEGGWIARACAENARAAGHEVREPSEVLVARIDRAVRGHPEALIGIQETQRELDRLGREAPVLVRTVVPERVSLTRLTGILRALAAERVSVRPLRELLEALAIDPLPDSDAALVELVRARLARQITHALLSGDTLAMLAIDPMIEDALRDGLRPDGETALDPALARDVTSAVRRALEDGSGQRAVLVTQPDVRSALRRLLAPELPDLPVLSYRELDPRVQVRHLGVVSP